MIINVRGQKTHFAPPERDSLERIKPLAEELRKEPMLCWLEAVPMGVIVINRHRQILFCNDLFKQISLKQTADEMMGMRPGEALDCVNSDLEAAGCGCSVFCDVCGAANAIVKSLEGKADCQECRLVRRVGEAEAPLDLHVFTRPFDYKGQPLVIVLAMDISHELRLRYLNRTFFHGLVNTVGGMASLTELTEAEAEDTDLFPLLVDSSRRTLRDVLYHQDIFAAEIGRLVAEMTPFQAGPYLEELISAQCHSKNRPPACIELEMEDNDITLVSDRRILGHVLRNMLDNALEAGEGLEGNVTLTCRLAGDRAILAVENPGLIPDNIQKEMFKRYVSTKSRDRGLGTYVIKLMTEKHLDGKVRFHSGNGRTTFEISIPAGTRGAA